ncbi:proteasome activator complex subunit 3 isoform X2 [Dendrobates tinctorius]|uniref:proteasome activator complex subunit 3 isoform X2 n=1 Tax=Dendrobates tinctorius TaxID=92724 RepID=UPI003CC9911E
MSSLLKVDQELKKKEPMLNVQDLSQIHSEMNLPVPEPILLSNSHDGIDAPTLKKRKLEDGGDNCAGTKVFVMPNGMLKSNAPLVEIIERVKPEIRLLIEKCNTVKMWVQLLIPRIEDGNNFGVSIQEETVAELRTVESEAASYLDQISRYYITRAKLVSKIAKYPHVEDYRRTVTEIDEKEYISLRLIISELRNQYVTLHDMILKNIEKIKRPRNSNAETLY